MVGFEAISLRAVGGVLAAGLAIAGMTASASAAPDKVRLLMCGSAELPERYTFMAAHGTGALKAIGEKFGTEIEFVEGITGSAECAAVFSRGEVDFTKNGVESGYSCLSCNSSDVIIPIPFFFAVWRIFY